MSLQEAKDCAFSPLYRLSSTSLRIWSRPEAQERVNARHFAQPPPRGCPDLMLLVRPVRELDGAAYTRVAGGPAETASSKKNVSVETSETENRNCISSWITCVRANF